MIPLPRAPKLAGLPRLKRPEAILRALGGRPVLMLLGMLALLSLSACRPDRPSAADPFDPWVGVEASSGKTFVDPEGLREVDFDPREHPVTWISDGDTIKVRKDGQIETIRLLGINTPETVDPRRPVQCFGREASARMKALVEGRSVLLATDPLEDRYDRNGRLLAYVWLPDGTFVNLELIRGGYANEADYGTRYAYADLFRAAAREAEAAGVGLWAADTCAGDYGAPADDFSDRVDPYAPSGPAAGSSDEAAEAGGLRIGQVVFDGSEGRTEPDEYVEIINDGPPRSMAGWRLRDASGTVFEFPDFEMFTGRRCRVYTNMAAPEHCGLSFFSAEPIWGNSGDVATLVDPSGRVVDTRCWGNACQRPRR